MPPLRDVLHRLAGANESDHLYRLVVEHSPYCIHRIDLQGNLSAMNPAGLLMMGVETEGDVRGLPYIEAVCEEDRDRVDALLLDAMQGTESEFEFSAANGARFSSNFVPIRDDHGKVISLMGITQDITERVAAADRLRHSEERLKLALAAATLGVWEIDPKTGTIEWYGGAQGSTKPLEHSIPPLEAYSSTVHPEDRANFDSALRGVIRAVGRFAIKIRVSSATGAIRHVEWSGRSSGDQSGNVDRVVGTVRDITEQVEHEAHLWQVQKLESLGVMAGGIAHDFNNLLVTIMGNIELALSDVDSSSSLAELLREAFTGSERAADLCRQMLAYSGRAPFDIGVVDLSGTVRDMAKLLRVAASNVVLNVVLDDEPSTIQGDVTQIRQVVMNLVINASEATQRTGAEVTVRTTRSDDPTVPAGETRLGESLPDGDYVVLEVTDVGVGMDDETVRRMFDPFFTSKQTGRGLGLSAILGITKAHGGALDVRTIEGKGTRIRVWLPFVDGSVPENAAPGGPETNSGVTRTALVVDDEPAVLALAVKILERAGWRTLAATSGAEALALVVRDRNQVDVAIVDLTMPGMGGADLAQALKSFDPGLSIVLTSGFSEEDAHAHLRDGVADAFLPKPYRSGDLMGAIDTATRVVGS